MRKLLSNRGFAWVSGLTSRATTRQADDDRFTDDEILTVVRAGESGMKLADLCQATGITVNTYYAWKARYGGLTTQQLREHRQRAQVRKRRVTMLACAVTVAAIGVGGLMVTRQSDAAPFAPPVVAAPPAPMAAAPAPSNQPAVPAAGDNAAGTGVPTASGPTADAPAASGAVDAGAVAPSPVPPATAAVAPAAATSVAPTAASSSRDGTAATVAARRGGRLPQANSGTADFVADPNAFSVQVAAMPDLQQARAALEKLTGAGYPAHITTTAVNRVEMYRVRVGPLATRAAAEQAAASLKRDGYASPWVTR